MLYGIGDSLTLVYPNNSELMGEEVEVITILSTIDKMYRIKVLKTGAVYAAKEHQLSPLENGNLPSRWRYCTWSPHLKKL